MNTTAVRNAANSVGRLAPRAYMVLCLTHFRRHWKAYSLPLLGLFVFQLFFRIDVNLTDSLPDHAFLTVKGWTSGIERGDYVAFEYQGTGKESPFPRGFHFVKIVGGVAGDEIAMDGQRRFWRKGREIVGDQYLGTAKTHSRKGLPLAAGPVGVIPPGHYYVHAPHPDSLDSRYALTGWVKEEHIIGRTFAIPLSAP
jgi:conjugal transfer pilin signal peptidase TrbI